MKKIIIKALVFVISFLAGMGLVRMAKAQDVESSLLWKVSGNGLEQPSYVYGTIHMICAEDFKLDAPLKQAFEESEVIIMELDMDAPDMMAKMQQYMVNPKMENISTHLSEEQLATLNAFFKANYGADLSQLGVIKPFALMSMVLPKLITCSDVKAFETEFVTMAKAQNKEILGLETVEMQMTLFDSVNTDEQVDWLVSLFEEKEEQQVIFASMANAYKNNDLEGLFKLISESPDMKDYTDVMLYDRNAKWIPKMEESMKKQPAFFAVGAGHLASDKGVIQLLKDQGYTVEAIQINR